MKTIAFLLSSIFLLVIALPLEHLRAAALIDLGIGLDYGAHTNTNINTDVGGNTMEVRSNAAAESEATSAPAAVSTEDEFSAYASSTLEKDSRLEGVTYAPDEITVWYQEEGRLLALIPIKFKMKATAYPDGRVEVAYPWYSKITIDRKDELKSRLGVAVSSALSQSTVGTLHGAQMPEKFSAHEAVAVTAKMLEALKSSSVTHGEELDSTTSQAVQ